jgi:adenylate cyclase class 2
VLEREIKLRYPSADEARSAVARIGAVPFRARRLQHDVVLDTPGGTLNGQRSMLRVRMEGGRGLLTFKGPVQPAAVKVREEIESEISDGPGVLRVLARLGFEVVFRYEKYREEFTASGALIAIDETIVGTYIEIEGSDEAIADVAAALGRAPGDYILESYRAIYFREREARGLATADMLLDPDRDWTSR